MNKVKVPYSKNLEAYLEHHSATEYTVTKDKKEIHLDCHDDFDTLQLGYDWGRHEHREKPQSFLLHKEYADLLQQAIELYSEDSYIMVNSIDIREGTNPNMPEMREIYVLPTGITHLFGIFNRYGKLVAEYNKKG